MHLQQNLFLFHFPHIMRQPVCLFSVSTATFSLSGLINYLSFTPLFTIEILIYTLEEIRKWMYNAEKENMIVFACACFHPPPPLPPPPLPPPPPPFLELGALLCFSSLFSKSGDWTEV